jgi:hypothetical protein
MEFLVTGGILGNKYDGKMQAFLGPNMKVKEQIVELENATTTINILKRCLETEEKKNECCKIILDEQRIICGGLEVHDFA